MRIVIGASSVAAALSLNRHRTKDEVVAELLKKYAPTLKSRPKTTAERAREVIASSPETASAVAAAVSARTDNGTEAVAVAATAKRKIERDETLSPEQKRVAIDHARSAVYSRHGTRNEAVTCDAIQQQSTEGVRLEKDNSFHELEVCTVGDNTFVIVGRVDRIEVRDDDGTRTLVEVKNRMHRLFGRIPQYEFIQLQVYLQLLGLVHGRLVEQHDDEIASYPVVRDEELWSNELLPGLKGFCIELNSAMHPPEENS